MIKLPKAAGIGGDISPPIGGGNGIPRAPIGGSDIDSIADPPPIDDISDPFELSSILIGILKANFFAYRLFFQFLSFRAF